MSKKLYNSLVDFVILAGFDQDTGLVMIDGQVRIASNCSLFAKSWFRLISHRIGFS